MTTLNVPNIWIPRRRRIVPPWWLNAVLPYRDRKKPRTQGVRPMSGEAGCSCCCQCNDCGYKRCFVTLDILGTWATNTPPYCTESNSEDYLAFIGCEDGIATFADDGSIHGEFPNRSPNVVYYDCVHNAWSVKDNTILSRATGFTTIIASLSDITENDCRRFRAGAMTGTICGDPIDIVFDFELFVGGYYSDGCPS